MLEKQPRTTIDLIRELEIEAAHYSTVALAVGFDHTTLFVFSGGGRQPHKTERYGQCGWRTNWLRDV